MLWRKFQPAEIDRADKSLSDLTYDLLDRKSYSLAKVLLDFALLTLKKYGSEQNRPIFLINRAQAYKWSGDPETASKILNESRFERNSQRPFNWLTQVLTDDCRRAAEAS